MAEDKVYKILICDAVGLRRGHDGNPDVSEVTSFIESHGGVFHKKGEAGVGSLDPHKIHFFYLPHLSTEQDILNISEHGQYDAVIAAATFLPADAIFESGGVRIGAGTGNMACRCWGGGNGVGGTAPLMNTPSFNSRATAQMVMKAVLRFLPDLPLDTLHRLTVEGDFDTGKNLADFPTEKLEGKTMAILGYGNIGREVALLGKAFGMHIKIYARPKHQDWIESEGFIFSHTPQEAAKSAHVLSVHLGLGPRDAITGKFANEGVVNTDIFNHLANGATFVNFDRGEVADALALDAAMATGQIFFAAIDADVFRSDDGTISGPLTPYLPLAQKYGSRTLLLPHVAADTCHTSRVEGAKQAVIQIVNSIRYGVVVNLKGNLPEGFEDGGAQTVKGVGKVQRSAIVYILKDSVKVDQLSQQLTEMLRCWNKLRALPANECENQVDLQAQALIKSINTYITLIDQYGLRGPF